MLPLYFQGDEVEDSLRYGLKILTRRGIDEYQILAAENRPLTSGYSMLPESSAASSECQADWGPEEFILSSDSIFQVSSVTEVNQVWIVYRENKGWWVSIYL